MRKDTGAIRKREPWGRVDGRRVERVSLTNVHGMQVKVINFGARVTEIQVPDRVGNLADVVLGFDHLHDYIEDRAYLGGLIGRVANRINTGEFMIGGETYKLTRNHGRHHLHGGACGFDRKVWDIVANGVSCPWDTQQTLTLELISPDGEEGYPGRVQVRVCFILTDDNELRLEVTARADRPTPINLAHHGYWNLSGQDGNDILKHVLLLNCSGYTVVDDEGIPSGAIASVRDTALDFRHAHPIGRDVGSSPPRGRVSVRNGFDHNLVIDGVPGSLRGVGSLYDPESGRLMEVETTQPGLQLYSGNFLDGLTGGKGVLHRQHSGVCLETQHYPDSVNHPGFPESMIAPGKDYHEVTVFRFSNR